MDDMQLINRNDIVWRLGCNDDGCTIVYARSTDIDAMPTIDAVPVVRCKDCKWFNKLGCAINIVDDSDRPKENDFCSFGERKGNG